MDDAHHHGDVDDATRLNEAHINVPRGSSQPGSSDAVCENCSAIPWEYLCQPMYEWDESGTVPRINEIGPEEDRVVKVSRRRLRRELEHDLDPSNVKQKLIWEALKTGNPADVIKVRRITTPPGWLRDVSCPVCSSIRATLEMRNVFGDHSFGFLQQCASSQNDVPSTGLLRFEFYNNNCALVFGDGSMKPAAASDSKSALDDEELAYASSEYDESDPRVESSDSDAGERFPTLESPDSKLKDPGSIFEGHSSYFIESRFGLCDVSLYLKDCNLNPYGGFGWNILITSLDAELVKIAVHHLIPPEIDYGLIRRSIHECRSAHGTACNGSGLTRIRNLSVIDCKRRRVVPAPQSCEYVALSYVWGQTINLDTQSSLDRVEEAPQTIEDSIHVTLQLGYEYLWIDRYCIDQRDTEETARQIEQMADIYAAAQISLVAVAGVDPHQGLPGVRRQRKRMGTIRGFGLFSPTTLRNDKDITRAKWFQRAWTFQECYFSRRRLFFTDHRSIYTCKETAISGDKTGLLAGRDTSFENRLTSFFEVVQKCTLRPVDTRDSSFNLSKSDEAMVQMLSLLEVYSARELTYEHDALRAVLGALRTFSTHQILEYWGVPFRPAAVYSEELEGIPDIEIALLWFSPFSFRPQSRRKGFPSWSPMGWTNIIRWFWRNRLEDGSFSRPWQPRVQYGDGQVDLDGDKLLAVSVLTQIGGIHLHKENGLGGMRNPVPLDMRDMRKIAVENATQCLEFMVPTVDLMSGPVVSGPNVDWRETVSFPFSEHGHMLLEPRWDLDDSPISGEENTGNEFKGLLLSESNGAADGKIPQDELAQFILIVRHCESHYERIGILKLPEVPFYLAKGWMHDGRTVVIPECYSPQNSKTLAPVSREAIVRCQLERQNNPDAHLVGPCHLLVTDKNWWRQYFKTETIVLG